MRNPWLGLERGSARFVLEMDLEKEQIYTSSNRGQKDDFRLVTSVVPEPWCGPIETAKVLVLSGNPHWDERDWATPPEVHDAMWSNLSGSEPMYLLRPEFENSRGSDWYRMKLLKNVLQECDEEIVRNSLCLVDFIGYRSHRWDQGLRFPSQAFTAHQVELAMSRNAVIVVSRGFRPWVELVPSLAAYKNFFLNSSAQNVRISQNNTTAAGFAAVVNALS